MRIDEADNTAQYWPNLGSQQSAIAIRPESPFASAKCWADDGGLCRLFKLTDLQPKLVLVSALYTKPIVTFTMASSFESKKARNWPMDGTLLGHVSLLPRQIFLEVRKPEFGTALSRYSLTLNQSNFY